MRSMGHQVRTLKNVESEDEPRILLENPETDEDYCLLSSDESESDDCLLSSDESDSDDDDASLESRTYSGPHRRAKFISGDYNTASPSNSGTLTLDRVSESIRNEQETLATQSQVFWQQSHSEKSPFKAIGKEA